MGTKASILHSLIGTTATSEIAVANAMKLEILKEGGVSDRPAFVQKVERQSSST